MIDRSVSLISHDHTHLHLWDVMGRTGLIVIGVGKAGERGFQMPYRFSAICERLGERGVNLIFVCQKQSARHVTDATSLFGACYRRKPFLFLDDAGKFPVRPTCARSARAVYLEREMNRLDSTEVALGGESWDPLLRAFFAQVVAGSMQ